MNAPIRVTDHQQVPFAIRIAYGIGSIADATKNTAFNAFLVVYYATVLGLPGTLSGLAIFIALCVDAVTDPMVGSISDHFRSRWGRRHPFMYFAAVPMGLCFFGLFSPPEGLSEQQLFVWLVAFAIGVRLFLTFYSVPSNALGPEMTTDYDERTQLVAFRWLIGWGGGAIVTAAAWFFIFADVVQKGDGRLDPANYQIFGLVGAIVVTTAILASSLGTHRLIPHLHQANADAQGFSLIEFGRDAVSAFKNHSLRVVLASSLFSATAMGISEVLGTYMSTWFWEFETGQMGVMALAVIFPLLLGFSLVGPISGRLDKRQAIIVLALFAILWGPLPVLFRFAGWMPENGSDLLVIVIMAHGMFSVGAMIQIGILNSSIVMDITDEYEYETGERREGTFMATIAFMGKAISGFGNFLGGVLIDAIDFPTGATDAAVGAVPDETIFLLGLAAGPGMAVFHLFGIWFMSRLRLTRERYAMIASALEERRRTTD